MSEPPPKRAKLDEILEGKSEILICGLCKKPLSHDKKNVAFQGTLFHPHCFVCASCGQQLENSFGEREGLPYCGDHFQKKRTEPPFHGIAFKVSKLAEYQVANYNVYPIPTIYCNPPLPSQALILAKLIDDTMNSQVVDGFVDGEMKLMKPGQTMLQFTGLKLHRINVIKESLKLRKGKSVNHKFSIQFSIGNQLVVSSTSFHIVSSCSQLPESIKGLMRPRATVKDSKGQEATTEDQMKEIRGQLEAAITAGNSQAASRFAAQLALLNQLITE